MINNKNQVRSAEIDRLFGSKSNLGSKSNGFCSVADVLVQYSYRQ